LQAEGCPTDCQISIVLCADRRIRTLNRIWRGIDKSTDVLSFSQAEDSPVFPDAPAPLGDVIISIPTALRQAARAGKSLQSEINFLLAHGLLHLTGWDHPNARALEKMLARQEELLAITSAAK
jgi:probable rRNA maturation factor